MGAGMTMRPETVFNSKIGELFDRRNVVSDVSGSGNNWAHGHNEYGPRYHDAIIDRVRAAVEHCDSIQCFLLLHSLGGGTGSGLGTYVLGALEPEFPDVFRFCVSVFPGGDEHVITSPYNSVLALRELAEHADCVLPIENEALLDIVNSGKRPDRDEGEGGRRPGDRRGAFDSMNTVAAHVITNLTCSMRFEGSLNVDLNEITTNMVPYPRMHFLMSSGAAAPRGLDAMFNDAFERANHVIKTNPLEHTYLACGLLVRGDVKVSDIQHNISRLRPRLRVAHWNAEGFKVGLCGARPLGGTRSVLCLSNNCAIAGTFSAMHERFDAFYRHRAHLHHYTEYMDVAGFATAAESIRDLTREYRALDRSYLPPATDVVREMPEF